MFFELLHTPLYIIPWLLAIILSIGLHEFSHALAGYLQGDDTAERAGRLTLNPLAHIDWIGLALMVFVGFGWGKPTPYNPYNLRFKKWGSALVGLAGPASNFVVVIVALILYKVLGFPNPLFVEFSGDLNLLGVFLLLSIYLNLSLGIFNLIPIPPLDGSKVLYSVLAIRQPATVMWLETNGPWLLFALVLFGQSFLGLIMGQALVLLYSLFGYI